MNFRFVNGNMIFKIKRFYCYKILYKI